MLKRLAYIFVMAGTCLLSLHLMISGIRLLVEGPQLTLIDGYAVASVFDTPAYAVMQIVAGAIVVVVGDKLRRMIKRHIILEGGQG